MKLLSIIVTASSLLLITFFQNCSPMQPQSAETQTSQTPVRLSEANYFKEPKPELLCGKEGYEFLLRNYIRPYCIACHSKGGFSPPFADNDIETAYFATTFVTKERWQASTTNNKFCGPSCELSTEGEVYKGLMEWLEHEKNCPTD